MATTSGSSGSAYINDLHIALDDVVAAFTEHGVANDKCAVAAKECTATANELVVTAKAYMAAYADLEIAIIQLKAIIKCAADISGAPPAHVKAMSDIVLDFYNTTIKAHKTIVDVSNSTEKAVAAYHAKNEALRADAAVFGSKSNIANNKLVAFNTKLREASNVLPKREVTAFHSKVAEVANHHGLDKAKIAIAEQFAAAKAADLAEKKCTDMATMQNAVNNDINAAVNRMSEVFEKYATGMDEMVRNIKRSSSS